MALRNQKGVSSEVALRIQTIAKEMGYQQPALLHEAMGQLRLIHAAKFNAQLALCTDLDLEREDFSKNRQYGGLVSTASKFGYGIERFCMPKYNGRTLRMTLRSRNIRGILLDTYALPAEFNFLFEEFACVYFGSARRFGLPMHFVQGDDFLAGKKSLQEVVSRGYRRIGFVRCHEFDPEGLCRAGVNSTTSDYISLHTLEVRKHEAFSKDEFLTWCKTEKVECVITMIMKIRPWLEESGYQIPRDIGVVHVKKAAEEKDDWSGIDPLWEEISGAGVDKLVSMLRKGTSGCPPVQECILIEGAWDEGTTLKPRLNHLLYETEPPVLAAITKKSPTLKCIPMQPYANRSFTRPGGWFGNLSLQHCVPGEYNVCGTRFQILDEAVDGKAVLIMASRQCPGIGTPNPAEVNIPIGRRVKAIHFLHACGWSRGPIRNFATYHFLDSHGRGPSLPLVDRREVSGPESDGNIQDWFPHLEPLSLFDVRPLHLTAYGNTALYSAYLYIQEWVNPNPYTVLDTLRIASNTEAQTTLGVLAITLVL